MNLNGASNPNPSIVLRDQKFSQNRPQCSSLYSSLSSLWSPPLITTSQSCVTIFSRVSHHHQTSPDRPQNLDRSSSSAMPCLSLDTSIAPSSVSRSSLNLLPEMPLQSSEEKALILDCSICFSQFNNVFRCPKLLQCHHTFCLECLARMNMKSSDPTTIQCPLCRQYTPLPAQGLPKLATNHKVLSFLPAAMQRVDSIHFIRNEGKLQVKRISIEDPSVFPCFFLLLTAESLKILQLICPPPIMNLNSNPTLCSSVDSSLPSLWSPPVIPTSQSSVTIHRHIYNHHQASTDLDRTQNLERSSRSALQLLTSDPSNAPSSGSRSSLHLLPGTPRPDQVSFIISSTDLQPEPITLQSSKEKTPDLDCSICFSQFNNVFRCPKLLQCHHTFCLECLARMNMKSSDPTTIQCPLCRHYTPLPAQGVPKLPTDYNVLYCLPAPMQRVNSIHFIRNEGKLHVKRSAEVQEPGGQSSLPVTLENESVDVEQPSLSLDLGLPSRSLDTVPSSRSLDVELSSSSPDEELPIRSREVGRLSRHLDVRPPGHSQGRPGELVRMDRGLFSVMEWLNSKMPFIMIIMGVLIFIMTFLIGYRESF